MKSFVSGRGRERDTKKRRCAFWWWSWQPATLCMRASEKQHSSSLQLLALLVMKTWVWTKTGSQLGTQDGFISCVPSWKPHVPNFAVLYYLFLCTHTVQHMLILPTVIRCMTRDSNGTNHYFLLDKTAWWDFVCLLSILGPLLMHRSKTCRHTLICRTAICWRFLK